MGGVLLVFVVSTTQSMMCVQYIFQGVPALRIVMTVFSLRIYCSLSLRCVANQYGGLWEVHFGSSLCNCSMYSTTVCE